MFCYLKRSYDTAFEVDDAEAMENRLKYYGIEHTRAVVPDTEAVQLFFYDPHGYVCCTLECIVTSKHAVTRDVWQPPV